MINLLDINNWKKRFGLLPIKLKPNVEDNYLMLNGGHGDFCIQTTPANGEPKDYYSHSWSTNTKNYVVLDNDNVSIFNWARVKPEVISHQQVSDNFDKFYQYILSRSYKSEKDVVPFIIDIFKQFRNLTREKTKPVEALNLLFLLLTSLEEDYTNFDSKKWNVDPVHVPEDFDFYVTKIQNGVSNIKPELDLIIRHAAGVLFQEAQKEVLFFNPQRDLFGGISSVISTTNTIYSSVHYTPQYIARTIVENAVRRIDLSKPNLKIFDPACGSSEFLIEVLKQLRELHYVGNISIEGWDSSETAITTSKFLLAYEKRTIWHASLNFDIRLVSDSLTELWQDDYDLILMNPPFVSWEILDKKSREAVKETLQTSFAGKPNQASAFLLKAVKSLNKSGVIGCVIPSSIFTSNSYMNLRNELYDRLSLDLIGKLGNFVFEDALTDVSLIVAHNPKQLDTPLVLWTRNEKGIAQDALRDLRKMTFSNELTINEKDYSIFQPSIFPILQNSWKAVSFRESEFLKRVQRFIFDKRLFHVSAIFSVKQGINSGNNKLFKLKAADYQRLPEQEQLFFRPTIDNESVKNGILYRKNYVWYPYGADGILITSEDQFRNEAPAFFESISHYREELAGRARKGLINWWHLSEHRKWLLIKEPRLVSTRFGNSQSFAFDQEGAFIVENGNAWLPKKPFQDSDYLFYLGLFSSPFFDKLLSIYSKQLSGGNWYDLGMKYSQNIPVPNVHQSEVIQSEGYIKLVEAGREISEGNIHAKYGTEDVLQKYFYPEI